MTIAGTVDTSAAALASARELGWTAALPFLPRDAESVWSRAADLRDNIYKAAEAACRQLEIDALVNKSIDLVYPAWVSVEAWLPAGSPGATYRVFGTFSIEPKPHSKFEFEVTIGSERGERQKRYGPYKPLSGSEVEAWSTYILDRGPRPPLGPSRIRK